MERGDDKGDKRGSQKLYPQLKTPWQPGQSGNPLGRAKAPPFVSKHAGALDKIADHLDEAIDVVKQIMRKTRTSPGDEIRLRAANSFIDRIVGKAPQSVAVSSVHRTISADGTIIEGSNGLSSAASSPLLRNAQAHFAREDVRRLAPSEASRDDASTQAEPADVTTRPRAVPGTPL